MTKKERKLLMRRPSRMQENKSSTPEEALASFFDSFTLEECRMHLWELYERCVISYASEHTVYETAADILFFYTQTEMLMEAAWLMNNKQQRKLKKRQNRPVN